MSDQNEKQNHPKRSRKKLWLIGVIGAIIVALILIVPRVIPAGIVFNAPETNDQDGLEARIEQLRKPNVQPSDVRAIYRERNERFDVIDDKISELCESLLQSGEFEPFTTIYQQMPDGVQAKIDEYADTHCEQLWETAIKSEDYETAEHWIRAAGIALGKLQYAERADQLARLFVERNTVVAIQQAYDSGRYADIPTQAATIENPPYREQVDEKLSQWSDAMASQAETYYLQKSYMDAVKCANIALNFKETSRTLLLLETVSKPDYTWLDRVQRSDYTYTIHWEPYQFDPVRPVSYMKVTTFDQQERERMERLIFAFASLYPPDYFNRYVKDILCYKSCRVVSFYDGKPVYDENGEPSWEEIYAATGNGHIIITDRFNSEMETVRALTHEMGHVETDYGDPDHKADGDQVLQALKELNAAGFLYYYDREGIYSTANIPGWRSTDNDSDWKLGFARRYGMLDNREDFTTLMEKLMMGQWMNMKDYPVLMQKFEAVIQFRKKLHPAFTEDFYRKVLPDYLSGQAWYSR